MRVSSSSWSFAVMYKHILLCMWCCNGCRNLPSWCSEDSWCFSGQLRFYFPFLSLPRWYYENSHTSIMPSRPHTTLTRRCSLFSYNLVWEFLFSCSRVQWYFNDVREITRMCLPLLSLGQARLKLYWALLTAYFWDRCYCWIFLSICRKSDRIDCSRAMCVRVCATKSRRCHQMIKNRWFCGGHGDEV